MNHRKLYSQQYYLEHKQGIKEQHRKYYLEHRAEILAKQVGSIGRKLYCKKRKIEALSAYSLTKPPSCVYCGIDDVDVLTIDHINGEGYQHRKRLKGRNIYIWLRKEGYPKGFQTLCFNCNWKKRIAGINK